MKYLGGKYRLGPKIAAVIAARSRRPVWDAFCGGLSTAAAFSKAGLTAYCSDIHPGLIALYREVAQAPISESVFISEADYAAARQLPDSDPFKAFVGFAGSFGGKWFGGYARGGGRNFIAEAIRSLNRDIPAIARSGGDFAEADFLSIPPGPIDWTLYLDPPYAGTTGYFRAFDPAKFWALASAWAQYTDVFVSEYEAPPGWAVVGEWAHSVSICKKTKPTGASVERLFYRGPS